MIFYNAKYDVYIQGCKMFVFEPGVPGEYYLTNSEQLDITAGFSVEVCEQLVVRGCPKKQAQSLVQAYRNYIK